MRTIEGPGQLARKEALEEKKGSHAKKLSSKDLKKTAEKGVSELFSKGEWRESAILTFHQEATYRNEHLGISGGQENSLQKQEKKGGIAL